MPTMTDDTPVNPTPVDQSARERTGRRFRSVGKSGRAWWRSSAEPRIPDPHGVPSWHFAPGTAWPRAAVMAAVAIMAFGVAVRVAQLFFNQMLTHDEAAVAINVAGRSFMELLQPLSHHQAAPIGFLWAAKICMLLFGESTLAVRIVPVGASILSIFAFYALARRTLNWQGALAALAMFCLSYRLITYSLEFKQYSTDILISCVLLLIGDRCRREAWGLRGMMGLALAGAVAVWLSLPSAFVLAGIGTALLLIRFREGGLPGALPMLPVIVAWLASFAMQYAILFSVCAADPYLQQFWIHAFLPFPPTDMAHLVAYRDALIALFLHPVGAAYPVLGMLLAVTGCAWLWAERKHVMAMILLILAATALASTMHRYPFAGRLMFFIAPGLMLLMGAGIEALFHRGQRTGIIVGAVIAVMLGQPLITTASRFLVRSRGTFVLAPLFDVLATEHRPGDFILACGGTNTVLEFYSPQYGITSPEFAHIPEVGQPNFDPTTHAPAVDGLAGRARVWILLNVGPTAINGHDRRPSIDWSTVLNRADAMGTKLAEHRTATSALLLYDLSRPPATSAIVPTGR